MNKRALYTFSEPDILNYLVTHRYCQDIALLLVVHMNNQMAVGCVSSLLSAHHLLLFRSHCAKISMLCIIEAITKQGKEYLYV